MANKWSDIKRKKDQVVVLTTNVPGEDFVIRSNPTDAAVKKFVKEHHRRFLAREFAGPSQDRLASQIRTATRYPNEVDYRLGVDGEAIDISSIISKVSG